ncbi:hypothetical protein ABIC22_004672 [Paenibacillus sp. PvP094]
MSETQFYKLTDSLDNTKKAANHFDRLLLFKLTGRIDIIL